MIKPESYGGKTCKKMSLRNLSLLMKPAVTSINPGARVVLKAKHVFMMMHPKARKNAVV
jgi:hypothetical protein